jgi:hypothetical protein
MDHLFLMARLIFGGFCGFLRADWFSAAHRAVVHRTVPRCVTPVMHNFCALSLPRPWPYSLELRRQRITV